MAPVLNCVLHLGIPENDSTINLSKEEKLEQVRKGRAFCRVETAHLPIYRCTDVIYCTSFANFANLQHINLQIYDIRITNYEKGQAGKDRKGKEQGGDEGIGTWKEGWKEPGERRLFWNLCLLTKKILTGLFLLVGIFRTGLIITYRLAFFVLGPFLSGWHLSYWIGMKIHFFLTVINGLFFLAGTNVLRRCPR
jgi:hypothetical protein